MYACMDGGSSGANGQDPEEPSTPRAAVSEVTSAAQSNTSPGRSSSSEEVDDSLEEVEGDSSGIEDEEPGRSDDDKHEEEEEEEYDDASEPDDDELEEELREAGGDATAMPALITGGSEPDINGEKVGELFEFERRKKSGNDPAKDKREPTVKKELNQQKEVLTAEKQLRQSDLAGTPVALEKNTEDRLQERKSDVGGLRGPEPSPGTVASSESSFGQQPPEGRKRKRQDDELEAYLIDAYAALAERLKLHRGLGDEALRWAHALELLDGDPKMLERLNRFFRHLTDSRHSTEAQKRLAKSSGTLVLEPTTASATSPSVQTSSNRATKKPSKKKKKKRKKKKKPWQNKPVIAVEASSPSAVLAFASTTETPRVTTSRSADKWHVVADRLFGQSWPSDDLEDHESGLAKLRYSGSSKQRMIDSMGRPMADKERENLEALNAERQALMLKAAREYSEPRVLHFGKINTHRQTSDEDRDDVFDSNERAYQNVHYGHLISSPSRVGPSRGQSEQERARHFGPNQEYVPSGLEFDETKSWPEDGPKFGYGSPWARVDEGNVRPRPAWDWRRLAGLPIAASKTWLPLNVERDYFDQAEEEDMARGWRQLQNWNVQHLRDNPPPWLEEKEVRGLQPKPYYWPKPESSREYGEESLMKVENHRNNDSLLKSKEDDPKEPPKLTMKTWNSLTSDPATWPFKLPGAKPWPKDENGKSYNPNADLARKLGLYNNGRPRPDKDPTKTSKQQKLRKLDKQDKTIGTEDSGRLAWNEGHPSWYNSMKLRENFDEVGSSTGDGSPNWNIEERPTSPTNEKTWPREKPTNEWKGGTSSNVWPAKYKQFVYHKVTGQPSSKSGLILDKPNKNAFIAVSDVSRPRYNWRKNDVEEVGLSDSVADNSDPFAGQLKMNVWKKSSGVNETGGKGADALENQLENLKETAGPVLLEVNVSIKNSSSHKISTSSTPIPAVNVGKSMLLARQDKNVTANKDNVK
ncbi:uncharacterized protein LOC106638851 [Copidosoma floridanum]|uniref:uncharacterized protein LOC106638851 n=1 Tax=Copidosoma floridanum TaxID=29053 RepID=UPI000C6FB304|nr:uncharacterized protein LOC106638851 [Copidosoma floridanum]